MTNDNDDHNASIEQLKARAAALARGRLIVHEAEDLGPALREQFWRRVVNAETAGSTNLATELSAAGVELPDPDGLDDTASHAALWNVIEALGRLHVFLDQTDHLSDRELYTKLVREVLPEEMDAFDRDDDSAWHIDLLGGGSLEDIALYLKYYADENTRQCWREEFPEETMAPHEDPPHDRDRDLPRT